MHRSGRTGRAGRPGTAVTLYADMEINDILRIEQGVGHGFKFERGAVPSAEQVMDLAGTVAREQIKAVSEDMVGYFRESARELLEEQDSEVCCRRVLPCKQTTTRCCWDCDTVYPGEMVKLWVRSGVIKLCGISPKIGARFGSIKGDSIPCL